MAVNFNKVIIAGNLTRDPELRYTPSGRPVAGLSVAINRTWKSETGEQREDTTFVEVEAWGRQGEVVAQYFKRGRPILIEGRLRQDRWEDKTSGQKRSRLLVVLESFSFLDSVGGRGEGQGNSNNPPPARGSSPSAPPPSRPAPPDDAPPPPDDDDVPF
jgi:single-strand DNA-binding protein